MVINFTPRPFQLLIGGYDVTDYTSEINLTRSRPELGKWISWSGSITLQSPADQTALPESFDDLDNAARWLPGNHPVILSIDGDRILTVRIADYKWDEIELTAEIEIQDLLTLMDSKDPPVDYAGLGFDPCRSAKVGEVTAKLMDLAGFPNAWDEDVFEGSFPVAPDYKGGGFLKSVATILSERGRWLYLDPMEQPAIVDFYGQVAQPTALYFVGGLPGQSELEVFQREKSPRWGYSEIEVRGTGKKFSDCSESEDWDIEQLGKLETGREYVSLREQFRVNYVRKNERKTTLTREQARRDAFPGRTFTSGPAGTNLIETHKIVTVEQYDIQGRLRKKVVNTSAVLGVLVPVPFGQGSEDKPDFESGRAAERWIDDGETVTTEYREYPTGAITGTSYNGLAPGPLREIDELTEKTYALTRETQITQLTARRVEERSRLVEASEETDINSIFIRKLQATRKIEQWIEDRGTTPPLGDNGFVPATGSCCDRFEYKLYEYDRRVFQNRDDGRGLLLANSDTKTGQTPPAWTTRAPDCPTCEFEITAKTTATVAGESPSNPLRGTRKAVIGFETLNTQSEAQAFLDFQTRRLTGQARNRQFVGPLRDWFLDRPDPCNRVRVNREEFVVVGESLLIRPEEMSMGAVGEFVGTCAPVPPPATPERSDYAIADNPIADIVQTTVTIDIPVNVISDISGADNPFTNIEIPVWILPDLSSETVPVTPIAIPVVTPEVLAVEV